MKNAGSITVSLVLLLSSHAEVRAEPSLAIVQECTRHLPTMERLYNIPAHWLAAIASTESGRYNQQLRMSVPWPWTINVSGKGYWFDTKQEAVQAVQYYQSKGIKSIDVGCMQVNLMYHGKNFSNLSQAFEPIYNIAYAAKFLRQNYETQGSWTKATAAYHSMQSRRGADYYRKVYQKWQQVVDRLNESVFAPPVQQAVQDRSPERRDSFAFRESPTTHGFSSRLPFHVTAPRGSQPPSVRMNNITVSRGNFPSASEEKAPDSIAIAANTMPYTPSVTPMDVTPSSPPLQQQSQDGIAIAPQSQEVVPPTRRYERGVLVIRANPEAEQGNAGVPAQLQLTSETEMLPQDAVQNRGQFAPRNVEAATPNGGYVTDRPQPKSVTPKFVF